MVHALTTDTAEKTTITRYMCMCMCMYVHAQLVPAILMHWAMAPATLCLAKGQAGPQAIQHGRRKERR